MRLPWLAREVRLHHHGTLVPMEGLDRLVSVSVGPSGEAVALWTDSAGVAALESGDARRENGDLGPGAAPASVAVTQHQRARTSAVTVPELIGVSPVAQPLPNGRILIVSTWAEWLPEGPERNATIYGSDGSAELSTCVGDGIHRVLATTDGAVWVAYHDMGIFGANGWGTGDSPEPIGSAGLVRFSPRLEVDWRFRGDRRSESRGGCPTPIDDCEAATLSGGTLWCYYYSEYPVVRIDDGEVRTWEPSKPAAPVATGVQALITDGRRVALAGGYTGKEDRIVVARLEERWVADRTLRLRLPDGSRLPSGVMMQGLADVLHVFVGREWYQIRLEDL
jgi:hypothetical protein